VTEVAASAGLVSLGGAYETIGELAEAERCFSLAERLGVRHLSG